MSNPGSMNAKQFLFVRDVILLLIYIVWRKGWRVTFGEAHRTPSQALLNYHGYEVEDLGESIRLKKTRQLSKTLNSNHLHRLAIDLNFFKPDGDGYTLTYAKEDIQEFGDFWESLSKQNRWGGNFTSFTDTPHFERVP